MADEASTSTQETEDPETGTVGESHGHGDSTDTEEDEWVGYIVAKLDNNIIPREADTVMNRIPRVPVEFCRNIKEPYKPCIISIGAHHRGKSETKEMEQCKWQCLQAILEGRQISHLKEFFKVLKPLEAQVKISYRGVDLESWYRWDFMEMMLLDSCFIVDYLLHHPSRYIPHPDTWRERQIDNDLLLLENQLPFSVLVETFPLVKEENEREQLCDFTLKFCRRVTPACPALTPELRETDFQHLLDFYHACLFFFNDRIRRGQCIESNQTTKRTILSASFLKNVVGIKFRSMKVTDKVMDARFSPQDGVMYITPLVIDAFTSSRFQNLIAFERYNGHLEPRFTAFAKIMDYIIDTSTDVSLLRQDGIIERSLGTDEDVAAIFNKTTGTFDPIPSELAETYQLADEYCNRPQMDGNLPAKVYEQSMGSNFHYCWSPHLFVRHYSSLCSYICIYQAS